MTSEKTASKPVITRWHVNLLILTGIMLHLLITMGGIVCVTDSSKGCPDWPACHGQLLPPLQVNSIIEYSHRLVAALTTPLILASLLAGMIRTRSIRWVSLPPLVAVPFLIAVIIFGALVVLSGIPAWLAAVDVGSALLVLALLLAAAVAAVQHRRHPHSPDRLSLRTPLSRLAMLSLAAVYAVLLSAPLAAGAGSPTRCLSFPLWVWNPLDVPGWPQAVRWGLAGLAGVSIAAMVFKALSDRFTNPLFRKIAVLSGILFLVEMGIGLQLMVMGFSVGWKIASAVFAVGLFSSLVILAAGTGLATPAMGESIGPADPESVPH